MDRILGAVWYTPWTFGLPVVGVVSVETLDGIKRYIGTGKGEDQEKDARHIVEFGSPFYVEVFNK